MKAAEELQERMDRLRWACQRTASELDTPLGLFLSECYVHLDMSQRFAFERLLAASDREINAWLLNHSQPQDQGICHIIGLIQRLVPDQSGFEHSQ